jgi:hypothetical protein
MWTNPRAFSYPLAVLLFLVTALAGCPPGDSPDGGGVFTLRERGPSSTQPSPDPAGRESSLPSSSAAAGGERASAGEGGGPMSRPVDVGAVGSSAPRHFVATRTDGAVVLADAADGAVLAATPGGDGELRDLAFDGPNARVLVASFGDVDAGELLALPLTLSPPAFGAAEPLFTIDGDLRTLPTDAGVLFFQLSYAGWRWWWTGSAGAGEVVLLPPKSAYVAQGAPPGTIRVETLAYGDPGGAQVLTRQAVVAGPDGLELEPALTLAIDVGADPSARLVGVPAVGDALLVDVMAGVVVVRPISGAALGSPIPVAGGVTAARVEAALPLRSGRLVVAATSGPPRLVVVTLGGAGEVVGSAALDLPAAFVAADRFFSRDLAAVSEDRVLVATPAGVLAVDIAVAVDGAPQLCVDPAFVGESLRGPLSVLPVGSATR